jgi:hypothetical protein
MPRSAHPARALFRSGRQSRGFEAWGARLLVTQGGTSEYNLPADTPQILSPHPPLAAPVLGDGHLSVHAFVDFWGCFPRLLLAPHAFHLKPQCGFPSLFPVQFLTFINDFSRSLTHSSEAPRHAPDARSAKPVFTQHIPRVFRFL